MEIKAKTKLDFEAAKALAHVSLYRKKNPKKSFALWCALCLILACLVVASAIWFKDWKTFVYPAIALALLFFMNAFTYYIIPRIQYKSLSKLKDVENEYVFTDDALKVLTRNESYSGVSEMKYGLFVKAYETSEYFFLFQTNSNVFVIDKSSLEGGGPEDVRGILKPYLKRNYFKCRY